MYYTYNIIFRYLQMTDLCHTLPTVEECFFRLVAKGSASRQESLCGVRAENGNINGCANIYIMYTLHSSCIYPVCRKNALLAYRREAET